MNKMLIINTSSNQQVKVGLQIEKKATFLISKTVHLKAQAVLPLIDRLLRKHQLKPKDIDAIEVNTGPGSFTGLRVGISVANALGLALKIPVNGKRNMLATPVYEARPR